MKMSIDQKNNSVKFPVSTKIYSKDIIYKACYVFIDRMYIFLEVSDRKDQLIVILKGKAKLSKKEIEKLEGEFMNELLNSMVRENISKRNQKVLEQIVGGAMAASLGMANVKDVDESDDCVENDDEAKEIEAAVAALRKELAEIESSADYETDALGIREIVIDGNEKATKSKKASGSTKKKSDAKNRKK